MAPATPTPGQQRYEDDILAAPQVGDVINLDGVRYRSDGAAFESIQYGNTMATLTLDQARRARQNPRTLSLEQMRTARVAPANLALPGASRTSAPSLGVSAPAAGPQLEIEHEDLASRQKSASRSARMKLPIKPAVSLLPQPSSIRVFGPRLRQLLTPAAVYSRNDH